MPDLALRFGLPLSELTKINGISSSTKLAEGSTILVPKEFTEDEINSVDEYLKLGKLPQIIVSKSSAISYRNRNRNRNNNNAEFDKPKLKLKTTGKNSLRSKYLAGGLNVKNIKNIKNAKKIKTAKKIKNAKNNHTKNVKNQNNVSKKIFEKSAKNIKPATKIIKSKSKK